MIRRHHLFTVARAVEALWGTQKQHRGFHYQQHRRWQHGFKINPKDIAMDVPVAQNRSVTDIIISPEEMKIFDFLDVTSAGTQSSPQETDSKANEDKRNRLRALFNEWDKKHNCTLSWTKFYDKYHNTTGDIAPENMEELRLETGLFSGLGTMPIDAIIAECNDTIKQNNNKIEENNNNIEHIFNNIEENNKCIGQFFEKNNNNIEKFFNKIEENKNDIRVTTVTNDNPSTTSENNCLTTDLVAIIANLVNTNKQYANNISDLHQLNANLDSENAKIKVRIQLMKTLKEVKPVSPNFRFTRSFSFGMVGRSDEFLAVMKQLVEGMGTAVKESNRPIAVLSAPRHGKSLLLQAVLEALRPPPTARDLPLVELFGESMPEVPKDVVVLALSLNGKSKIDDNCRANGRRAAAYLWSCVLGLSPDSGYVENGELAAWVLSRLFPGKQVVLMVDELTNLTDAFIHNQEELKILANSVLSFFGDRTTMIFTGFDAALASSFVSASGRPPRIVPLAPINPNSPDFMALLPLRTLLTDLYIREETKESNLLMLYELGKSTPGVLGAVAEQQFDNIPIVQLLKGKAFSAEVIPLVEEYVKVIAEGGNVIASEGLGAQLLEKKIGALWRGEHKRNKVMLVYIPPLFAYAAMRDQAPRSNFHSAFNEVVALMESWYKFLREHRNDTDTGAQRAWAQSGGLLYELFVLAALRMQDVALLRGLSYANTPTTTEHGVVKAGRLPGGSCYPAEPGATVLGTWLTAERTESVDIVRSLGGGRQQWIEVKNRSTKVGVRKLVKAVSDYLDNVPKDITEVEYIVLTHIPSSAAMGKSVSKMQCMETMRKQLPDGEERLCSDGRRVRLAYRIVFVGTAEAARFLSPLVASIAPNTGALHGDTCERRLLIQDLKDPNWLACKSKKEADELVMDIKSRKRVGPVYKQCEAATRDAENLYRTHSQK